MIAIQNDKLMTLGEVLTNVRRHMKSTYYDISANRDTAVYVLSAALEENENYIKGALKREADRP